MTWGQSVAVIWILIGVGMAWLWRNIVWPLIGGGMLSPETIAWLTFAAVALASFGLGFLGG